MSDILNDFKNIKATFPAIENQTQALVVPLSFEHMIKKDCPPSSVPGGIFSETSSLFGVRIYGLLEMDPFERALAFTKDQDARIFVKAVELLSEGSLEAAHDFIEEKFMMIERREETSKKPKTKEEKRQTKNQKQKQKRRRQTNWKQKRSKKI